jgi:hypothetical protein
MTMKRCFALLFAYAFFLSSTTWAAEEIRPLGMASANGGTSGDLRVGNTCTTSAGGKFYCGLNTTHLLFYADNTVSVNKLYPLAAADTGFAYVLGGTWSIDSVSTHRGRLCTGTKDNTTYLRMDGTCSVPPGSGAATVTSLPWDNITSTPTTLAGYGIVDAASAITDNSILPARLRTISGAPDNTTFYRGDGAWIASTVSPAGSTGAIQYNKGGVLGAVSGAGYDNAAETITLPAVISPSVTAAQTTSPGCLKLWEGSGGGTDATGFCAPATIADNTFYTLPSADGSDGQVLKTNGSKVLSWVSAPAADTITSGTNPTVGSAGKIAVDTTADQLLVYGGALNIFMATRSESFVIKSPTAADNPYLFKAPFPITLTAMDCITDGATKTVTMQLQECSATGTSCGNTLTSSLVCDSDNQNTTSFSDASIATGAWMKLIVSATENTPGFVSATIQFTPTRQ